MESESKKCSSCNFEGSIKEYFTSKYNKESKTCLKCRERGIKSRLKHKEERQENSRQWRKNNKDRVSLYNKHYNDEDNEKSWDEIKKENDIKNNVEGQASKHRKLHYKVEGIIGKKCSKGEWQSLSNYNYNSKHWDMLRTTCKNCMHTNRVERKEWITNYNKVYWIKTKVEQTLKNKLWKRNNRDRYNAYNRIYKSMWEKKQRLINPHFKMTRNLRCRFWNALKEQNAKKTCKTFDLIGCSVDQLKEYLSKKFTEGMTWENYGTRGWHIDHIKPCSKFDLRKVEEQEKCFHFTNLQPLWAFDNLSKNNKYEEPETFEEEEMEDVLLEFSDEIIEEIEEEEGPEIVFSDDED